MGARRKTWTDERIEVLMGNLLRVGVLTAGAVVLLGGIAYLARHGSQPVDLGRFHADSPELSSIGGVIEGVRTLDPRAIIQAGLLLLIATPIARVALAVIAFVMQRNGLYTLVSAIVLVLLLVSLIGS